jgi:galactose mutarotase-like enzyme
MSAGRFESPTARSSLHGEAMSSEAQIHPTHEIVSTDLRAKISCLGGELVRLRDAAGRDLLWDGNPAFWKGRAPLLFPIVGRVKGDRLKVNGHSYPMNQHGFARNAVFELVAREQSSCQFRLRSSAQTREHYPFDFVLEVAYQVSGGKLTVEVLVQNPSSEILPASVGFHPAFRWPLPYGAERAAHEILFEHDEHAPIARVFDGLLSPRRHSNPITARRLALADNLFAEDALIFLDLRSRSLHYGATRGRGLTVDFPDMPYLGIWTKPGAGFVCIEPWHGFASPEQFDGEFADKPGIVPIEPGQQKRFGMSVTLDPA